MHAYLGLGDLSSAGLWGDVGAQGAGWALESAAVGGLGLEWALEDQEAHAKLLHSDEGFAAAPRAAEAQAGDDRRSTNMQAPLHPWTPSFAPGAPRCLDATHSGPCSRCTPAPPRDQVPCYALVGDPGRKNGEKKLKHQLLRCGEWACPQARAALAANCDAEGFTALAMVLRREATSAALRKDHFFHIARFWGYSSDIWKPRPPLLERAPASKRPRSSAG